MRMIELQDKFVEEIVRSIKVRWDSIHVHYENMTVDGNNREIHTAFYFADGVKHQFSPALDAIDVLLELNDCQPEGQADKWTWVEFVMDRLGKYGFDYKYDMPPHIATVLRYS